MTIKIHAVKIAPKYLDAVVAGQKKAELRKNDRGYKTGDVLSLCEWKHGKYTGREWAAVITHVLPVNEIIADTENWAVLSIRSLSPLEVLEYIISNGVTESLAGGGQYGR
ncbi:DUF3850 domain-containing protein [Salmonella enterica subsp. enterica]|uniref:DUF3850 domain-containing protein n=1 Tax=Salmonella enterica TaxID=28901 RepID=UPI00126EC8DB|nr:DUF3850 domain-containing protein [Salmonella enterica]ECI1119382.1 DUF3850 domain-containing protein [Salmonella enterica subsp. enterica]EKR1388866.1 DUF3850 domain-containing protein [Salmonella enterica subsp. enterica serovar Javiana]EDN4448187.1 DUF3850 domain-containing protein [Salmonella enterica subsp. enterica]ELH8380391.1 DUF3850 domain-containing protein [Salmonella enterica subsp. enterica]HAE3619374.1 DUF3850 domain-containing protein [Salmonella enterica subsp. enterica sero